MKNTFTFTAIVFFVVVIVASCEKTMPPTPDENSLLDGPMEGLNTEEQAQFLKGDEAFAEVFTIEKGLGPIFVANQCDSCHAGDGKGSPFVKFTRFFQNKPLTYWLVQIRHQF